MVLNQKIKAEDGAISVLCLLIVSGFLIMFLAIYNYALYLLTNQRLEDSLEFSLNSILANYDKDVMRELGIFALEENQQLINLGKDYFLNNLTQASDPLDIELLDFQLTYNPASQLSDANILRQQIVKLEAYDGLLSLGSELIKFLDLHPLPNKSELIADVSSTEVETTVDKLAEFIASPQEEAATDLSLWQLLSPWPYFSWLDNQLPWQASSSIEETSSVDNQIAEQMDNLLGQGFGLKDIVENLSHDLKQCLTNGKDRLLQVEYILQQYDYMTAKPLRQRYFAKGEIEYILWGKSSAWSNIRLTVCQIFLLRTIINVSYNFLNSTNTSIKVRLAEAVLQGLHDSKADVEDLYSGKRIPAFPGQNKLMMTYKDHLRLFLLLQSANVQLIRMQELMAVNISYWRNDISQPIDLSKFYCALQIKTKVKLSLWPFGSILLKRQGEQGYEAGFRMVEAI